MVAWLQNGIKSAQQVWGSFAAFGVIAALAAAVVLIYAGISYFFPKKTPTVPSPSRSTIEDYEKRKKEAEENNKRARAEMTDADKAAGRYAQAALLQDIEGTIEVPGNEVPNELKEKERRSDREFDIRCEGYFDTAIPEGIDAFSVHPVLKRIHSNRISHSTVIGDPIKVAVLGQGPTGIVMALRAWQMGIAVTTVEKRSTYTRPNVLRISVAEMDSIAEACGVPELSKLIEKIDKGEIFEKKEGEDDFTGHPLVLAYTTGRMVKQTQDPGFENVFKAGEPFYSITIRDLEKVLSATAKAIERAEKTNIYNQMRDIIVADCYLSTTDLVNFWRDVRRNQKLTDTRFIKFKKLHDELLSGKFISEELIELERKASKTFQRYGEHEAELTKDGVLVVKEKLKEGEKSEAGKTFVVDADYIVSSLGASSTLGATALKLNHPELAEDLITNKLTLTEKKFYGTATFFYSPEYYQRTEDNGYEPIEGHPAIISSALTQDLAFDTEEVNILANILNNTSKRNLTDLIQYYEDIGREERDSSIFPLSLNNFMIENTESLRRNDREFDAGTYAGVYYKAFIQGYKLLQTEMDKNFGVDHRLPKTRFFTNRYNPYIGFELPDDFDKNLVSDYARQLLKLHLPAKEWNKITMKTDTQFPVQLQVSEAVTIPFKNKSTGKESTLIFAGDELASPHFMTASGAIKGFAATKKIATFFGQLVDAYSTAKEPTKDAIDTIKTNLEKGLRDIQVILARKAHRAGLLPILEEAYKLFTKHVVGKIVDVVLGSDSERDELDQVEDIGYIPLTRTSATSSSLRNKKK